MKKIIFITVIILLINANAALSEKAEKIKIDMDINTAYELMLNNNNFVKAVLEDIKVKKYKRNSAIGAFFPKIGLNATYIHFDKDIKTEVSSIPINNEKVTVPNLTIQDKNLGIFGVSAVWNIFTG